MKKDISNSTKITNKKSPKMKIKENSEIKLKNYSQLKKLKLNTFNPFNYLND